MNRIRAVIIVTICISIFVCTKKYNDNSQSEVLPTQTQEQLKIVQETTLKLQQANKVAQQKKEKFKTGYIKTDNVKVRVQPGKHNKIKSKLYYGDCIKFKGCYKKKWIKIKSKKLKGYILRKYIVKSKPKQQCFSSIPNSKLWSYMDYRCITNTSSYQYKLQRKAYTGTYGIRQVNGRYCIAVGSYFTKKVGSKIDLILSNGVIIHCILADCKADKDTDYKNQKTSDGSLLEVVVDTSNLHSIARRMGDIRYCNSKWKSKIKQIIIYK